MSLVLILAAATVTALAASDNVGADLNKGSISKASKPARARAAQKEAEAKAQEFKGSGKKAGDEVKAEAGEAPKEPESIWRKPVLPRGSAAKPKTQGGSN